jgi:hypothetical protein
MEMADIPIYRSPPLTDNSKCRDKRGALLA